MRLSLINVILCALILSGCASPLPNDQDGGHEETKKNIEHTDEAVKIADEHLKELPLRSFIHHMERNLIETALSVSSLAHDKDASVAIVTPPSHATEKRQTAPSTDPNANTSHNQSSQPTEILLQTTERVPAKGDLPTHILIDRISVQTLNNGLPSIPHFEVKHTKLITATVKDNGSGNSTEVSITGTATTTANREMMSSSSLEEEKKTTPGDLLNETVSNSSPIMKAGQPVDSEVLVTETTATTTTKAPIIKLQEAEKELKEKAAEIEAVPVILSARV